MIKNTKTVRINREARSDHKLARASHQSRFPGWVGALAIFLAVGSGLGLAACSDSEHINSDYGNRRDVRDARENNTVSSLCESLGAEAGCDPCEVLGFYGDGEICDNGLCDAPDIDCDDRDVENAPSEYHCDDDRDNDNDGDIDCEDADCMASLVCINSHQSDNEIDCEDGNDNDNDGYTDCDDSDCATRAACYVPYEIYCDNGSDDDNDGDIDCDDSDCALNRACHELSPTFETNCADGIDNDDDGDIDCRDDDCELFCRDW